MPRIDWELLMDTAAEIRKATKVAEWPNCNENVHARLTELIAILCDNNIAVDLCEEFNRVRIRYSQLKTVAEGDFSRCTDYIRKLAFSIERRVLMHRSAEERREAPE